MKRKVLVGIVLATLLLVVIVSSVAAVAPPIPILRNNCAHPIMGDVNFDGQVSPVDLSIIMAAYGSKLGQPGYRAYADLNCDRVISDWDLSIYDLGYRMWVEMIGPPRQER